MSDFQATYSGLTVGVDTPYPIVAADLDANQIRSAATVPLPRYHGGIRVDAWLGPRIIRLIVELEDGDINGGGADVDTARQAVLTAFAPTLTELPFVWESPGDGARRVLARPVAVRPSARDATNAEAGLVRFDITLEASDPFWYTNTETSTTVGVFAASGGLSYPVTYPKAYGAAGSGSGTVVTNGGTVETWPTLEIAGPSSGTLTNPIVENVTTGKTIDLSKSGGVSITTGQTLIIETHPVDRTIAFATGASRYGNLTDASEFWPLEPGDNEIRFRASGSTTGADLTVKHRDATL